MAITTLVPQNSLIINCNGGDLITEIQPTANKQKLLAIKITMKLLYIKKYYTKILYASRRANTRTEYGIYIKQLESFIGATSNMATEHVLNFLSSSYDKFAIVRML